MTHYLVNPHGEHIALTPTQQALLKDMLAKQEAHERALEAISDTAEAEHIARKAFGATLDAPLFMYRIRQAGDNDNE